MAFDQPSTYQGGKQGREIEYLLSTMNWKPSSIENANKLGEVVDKMVGTTGRDADKLRLRPGVLI
jgi:hypothetical protein